MYVYICPWRVRGKNTRRSRGTVAVYFKVVVPSVALADRCVTVAFVDRRVTVAFVDRCNPVQKEKEI